MLSSNKLKNNDTDLDNTSFGNEFDKKTNCQAFL